MCVHRGNTLRLQGCKRAWSLPHLKIMWRAAIARWTETEWAGSAWRPQRSWSQIPGPAGDEVVGGDRIRDPLFRNQMPD
jgi:hypothetical protein